MTYTVVVWNQGDTTVRPVGPTSCEANLLRGARSLARESHIGAEVVPWQDCNASVSRVESAARARRQRIAMAQIDDAQFCG